MALWGFPLRPDGGSQSQSSLLIDPRVSVEGPLANNPFCPLSLPPLLPLTSAAWNSHVQVLHFYPKNLICMDFGYIISVSSPPYAWSLAPFNARKSSWQNGVWASQSPALYPCTVSVPWISFFLGYSWCEDNLNILLYYLELSPHFGGVGKKKKSQANQWWSFILWWCCDD